MLDDLSLFLGLLGFVCSIGMRFTLRDRMRDNQQQDAGCPLNDRAHDTSSTMRATRTVRRR